MVRFCQYDNCPNEAVWAVKSGKENGSFLACRDHVMKVGKMFKKQTGFEPEYAILP